jgi:hypothetical protein
LTSNGAACNNILPNKLTSADNKVLDLCHSSPGILKPSDDVSDRKENNEARIHYEL